MKKKLTVVQVIGSGHCGSTLVDLMLGSHPDIFSCGELRTIYRGTIKEGFSNVLCMCGKQLQDCEFWSAVISGVPEEYCSFLYDLGVDANLISIESFLSAFEMKKHMDFDTYLRANEALYESISKVTGKNIIVDSSKDTFRAALLEKSKNLNIITIHVIRDGRAVYWSYKKKYKSAFKGLWLWLGTNVKVERYKHNFTKFYRIRYEDLVQNPKTMLTPILDQLGLTFSTDMLTLKREIKHHSGGNNMRFKKDQQIRLDESWRFHLKKRDLVLFYLTALWLNWFYRY